MDLFNQFEIENEYRNVSDLEYHREFISIEEHKTILSAIDDNPWLNDLKRRVQHYGYKYDYRKRRIDPSMHIGKIPDWCASIAKKIKDKGLIDFEPDQVIVNEYLPGQGISNHIDCEPCFEDTIISLSLNSLCVMQFTSDSFPRKVIPVLLEPRSLIILKGESRYKWMHGIKAVKSDNYYGQKISRNRRVSLTFRKVIIN